MFKNNYFNVEKLSDDSVLIMNKDGQPYKWGEGAVTCFCPAHNRETSPFLVVKYGDNTWSLCHAEAGPMPEAKKVLEKEHGECPIIFQEDFLEDEKDKKEEKISPTQDTCMIIKAGVKELVMGIMNKIKIRG